LPIAFLCRRVGSSALTDLRADPADDVPRIVHSEFPSWAAFSCAFELSPIAVWPEDIAEERFGSITSIRLCLV
jgi:hypothetical protein